MERELLKTPLTDFKRDKESNALINTNVHAYKLYKQQRKDRLSVKMKDERIGKLENELRDLKILVKGLLEKND